MKIIKKEEIIQKHQADHIFNEIKILSLWKNPMMIRTDGFNQDSANIYIEMDFVNGGELFTYWRKCVKFPLETALFYLGQLTLGLETLQSYKIAHRDLKPENILIMPNGYLKFVDFGCAKVCEGKTYTVCGTPEYMAPEMVLNEGHDFAVDWWSIGVLFYEMLVGITPFLDKDPMVMFNKIIKGDLKFPKTIDPNAKHLIKRWVTRDLAKRYGCLKNGASDIKKHKVFKDLDWNVLANSKIPAKFIPKVENSEDLSHYPTFEEDHTKPVEIKPEDDVFLNMFKPKK